MSHRSRIAAYLAHLDIVDLLLALVRLAAQVQRHVVLAGGGDVAELAQVGPRAALALVLAPRHVGLRSGARG